MFYQAGRLFFVSADQDVIHILKPSKFSYGRKNTKVEAFGFPLDVGPVQKLDSGIQRSDWSLKLTQESFDLLDEQLILDQKASAIASIQLPGSQTKLTVPSASPYTVTINGLTVDQEFYATVASDTNPVYLTQITGATAIAPGSFKVTANTVTFDAAQAGQTIAAYYLETKTSTVITGGTAAPASFGYCAFKGIIKGTRATRHVWFPRVAYTGDFEQSFGDKSEVSLEYDILTPAGWGQPYAFWAAT